MRLPQSDEAYNRRPREQSDDQRPHTETRDDGKKKKLSLHKPRQPAVEPVEHEDSEENIILEILSVLAMPIVVVFKLIFKLLTWTLLLLIEILGITIGAVAKILLMVLSKVSHRLTRTTESTI